MWTLTVGRRRYSDPDVVSLIRAAGELVDPRSSVLHQASTLNRQYTEMGGDLSHPITRLKILASLKGLRVKEMDQSRAKSEPRDAVLVPMDDGSRGIILFNPARPQSRVAFSIAHEVAHTFFPNSITGARFRSICAPNSREARELEALCDLGASELLMPRREFLGVTGSKMGLAVVDLATSAFGSSYESTVFRLATTYSGFAGAGLLRFRRRLAEERALVRRQKQTKLFASSHTQFDDMHTEPKYRRQSFFASDACDADDYIVRWNKSFGQSSCVYRAASMNGIVRAIEALPNRAGLLGNIEAVKAPFQREEADPAWPDVVFLWWC